MFHEDLFAPSSEQRSATKVDPNYLKSLGMTDKEVDGWQKLRAKYINKPIVEWDKVQTPDTSFFVNYDTLPQPEDKDLKSLLDKIVVVKLNGGLGNRMGCKGPKSVIEVAPGLNFLDIAVMHVEVMLSAYCPHVRNVWLLIAES